MGVSLSRSLLVALTGVPIRIRHALEVSRPLAVATKLVRVNGMYQGWLDKEIERLIQMAGSPTGPTLPLDP